MNWYNDCRPGNQVGTEQTVTESRLEGWIPKVRVALGSYFCVCQYYVAKKCLVLLFPFLPITKAGAKRDVSYPDLGNGQWEHRQIPQEQGGQRAVGEADLYIPTVAFITQILLYGANYAQKSQNDFKPAILSERFSLGLLILAAESLSFWGARYLTRMENASFLDSVAMVAYKNLHLCALYIISLSTSSHKVVSLAIGYFSIVVVYTAVILCNGTWSNEGKCAFGRSSSFGLHKLFGGNTPQLYVCAAHALSQGIILFLLAP